MSVVDRMRGALSRRPTEIDADTLVERVDGLRRFLTAAEGHIPQARLVTARTVVDRAGERLSLSRAHTVVALAGATGSGKSSLFNAISGLNLSPVGVRRPTTGVAHACVWGTEGAFPLLDWLGVPPGSRFARESQLDGDDQAALRGLVLLDLPDFDSVQEAHRVEVDRLLRLVDLVVWVLDPQKYADRIVHQQYLRQFASYRDITVVALNQADLLSAADLDRCLTDLRRLIVADGLDGVPVLATSTRAAPGLEELRTLLGGAVALRRAALNRLAGDVAGAVAELAPTVEPAAGQNLIDQDAVDQLDTRLAAAAGVPAVVDATGRAYRHRARAATGWPLLRWLGRLRPDPLRRLHLSDGTPALSKEERKALNSAITAAPVSIPTLPQATAAQQAAVALAGRRLADSASERLPEPWPAAMSAASRSRQADVPDALDRAVARTDLGMARRPVWWRVVGFVQWLAVLTALVGLGWLAVRYAFTFLGLPELPGPRVGELPLPTVLLLGGLLAGALIAMVVRPIISIAAGRARRRAERRLRAAVAEVADELVVAPVRQVITAYVTARDALGAAGR
ncbi:MAG TPA: GTPase [Micromonosporaceae bacterium]|nr:GTPase [Micromonosporaceae bacterium]